MDSKPKIDYSDYQFFTTLPSSEKILFLYDLMCTDYYESKSEIPTTNYIEYWHNMISKTILDSIDANVLFIKNYVVVNSDDEDYLHETIINLFEMGYILQEMPLYGLLEYVFHHQRYCKVYYLVGKGEKICLN